MIDELAGDAGGIAGVFVQNTLTLEAISRTIERGKPVVTLLSDLRHPLNASYVGLDNSAVRQTADYIPGRFVKQPSGRAPVTSETMNYLGLGEQEMSLRSVLADKLPHLETSSIIEKGPDRDAMVQRVAVQAKDPNIVGIDSVGGRNRVIVDTMEMAGLQPGETVYVGSEPTETSRRLMIDGWIDEVISFPANRAGKAVIRAMTEASGRGYCPRPGSFQRSRSITPKTPSSARSLQMQPSESLFQATSQLPHALRKANPCRTTVPTVHSHTNHLPAEVHDECKSPDP